MQIKSVISVPIKDFIHHYPRALFNDIPRVGAHFYDIPGSGCSLTTYPGHVEYNVFSLGVFKYVVCLCEGCDGCCVCLYCDAWSCRCSCMGSMSVSSCICCMFVSCVHPVAVPNAAF